MNASNSLLYAIVGSQVVLAFLLGMICDLLKSIERNTRPPKPDIKSFINRNTKGDRL